MGKPELVLQNLDEWMIRWKHFQTKSDWEIEQRAQCRRQRNYAVGAGTLVCSWLYTAAPSTVNRIFSAPHFFDMGIDVAIKDGLRNFLNSRRRFTPNGYGRLGAVFVPPYLVLAFLEHRGEQGRLNEYLAAETAFGEQARRLVKNGKLEEFLCPNVGATLPEKERVVMVQ